MNSVQPNFSSEQVAVGVDVGGTKIQIGAASGDGTVLFSKRYGMVRSSQEATVSSVMGALKDFMDKSPIGTRPCAIGIGLPGDIDPQRGIWLRTMNLRILQPVELARHIREQYGCPVYMDNDVHAATLAELYWGAGRDSGNFVYVNIGTGIAAGIVCNGRLLPGSSNFAGEIGHMVVETDGAPCHCGHIGCLENIASGGGLIQSAMKLMERYPYTILRHLREENRLNSSTIFQAAEDGDELASAIAQRALRGLGIAMVNIVNLLDPELLIFGGGVIRNRELLANLYEYVSAYALVGNRASLKSVRSSDLDADQVGMLGAACLALSKQQTKQG